MTVISSHKRHGGRHASTNTCSSSGERRRNRNRNSWKNSLATERLTNGGKRTRVALDSDGGDGVEAWIRIRRNGCGFRKQHYASQRRASRESGACEKKPRPHVAVPLDRFRILQRDTTPQKGRHTRHTEHCKS